MVESIEHIVEHGEGGSEVGPNLDFSSGVMAVELGDGMCREMGSAVPGVLE